MITITTELRARRFSDTERSFLYNKLKEPYVVKYDDYAVKFKSFLESLIKSRADPDLIYMGTRDYCINNNIYTIDPLCLGLPESYDYNGIKYKIASNFTLSIYLPTTTGKYGSVSTVNLVDIVKDRITKEELDFLKESLLEYTRLHLECIYFGRNSEIGYGYKFPGINTWGHLYNKYPKYFEIIYNEFYIKENYSKDEYYLVNKLKKKLGY
jgi:hypothetical protein